MKIGVTPHYYQRFEDEHLLMMAIYMEASSSWHRPRQTPHTKNREQQALSRPWDIIESREEIPLPEQGIASCSWHFMAMALPLCVVLHD